MKGYNVMGGNASGGNVRDGNVRDGMSGRYVGVVKFEYLKAYVIDNNLRKIYIFFDL